MSEGGTIRFLVGPTGSGKHAVAMALAGRTGGEIVSVDSMKVYCGLDIGAAKPSAEDRRRVRHHLIDLLEPEERFHAGRFVQEAERALAEIRSRGAAPVFSGGTFLYYKAFVYGLFRSPEPPSALREELFEVARTEGVGTLHESLAATDPESARKIHPNDVKRIVRALEVQRLTGRPMSELQKEWKGRPRSDVSAVALLRSREDLRKRVIARIDRMLEGGLLEETRRLLARQNPVNPEIRRAIGYQECAEVIEGRLPLAEAREQIIRRTHRFVRRQLTWIRRLPELHTVEIGGEEPPETTAGRVLDILG